MLLTITTTHQPTSDPPRLSAFERVVFDLAKPKHVIVTTEPQPDGQFRHRDHRFEWSRSQFQEWANRLAEGHGYTVRFAPIGPEDATLESPTQMAIFETKGQASQ